MAMKAEKNLIVGTISVEGFEGITSAGLTMYLCLLLHLFTTDAGVNLRRWICTLSLTNLQRPKEVQEHFGYVINLHVESSFASDSTHERDRRYRMDFES